MKRIVHTGWVIFLFVACMQSLAAQSVHEAIDQGDLQELKRLLSERPELLEARNGQNLTPLLLAAIRGRSEMVKALLDKGADQTAGDNEGSNALQNAAACGHMDILRLLVNHGADINSSDSQGMTALHFSCSRGHLECARYLISKEADLEAREQHDRTALFFASLIGNPLLCRLLIENHAQVDAANQYGRTPLTFAIRGNHPSVVTELIRGGADVNRKDTDGNAPLHLVCDSGQADLADLLLENGADIRMKNGQNGLPLHLAAMNGHRELVSRLLDRGVDVNLADDGGDTPLHGAAWRGDRRTVELLLNRQADIHAKNAQGKTPIDYAAQAGRGEMLRLLKSHGAAINDQKAGQYLKDRKIDANDSGAVRPITLTVLYDNYPVSPGTRTDWGFSCLVEGLEKTVLFDTGGDPEVLMENARHLNVALSRIDQIVISHNHWDHTGGLDRLRRSDPRPSVFVPRSMPYHFVRNVENTRGEVIAVNEPREICPHVYSTGEMGNRIKEQSLILNTGGGLVIVTGCSHQGIASIVRKTKELFDKEILLVMGGFHLMQHTDDQIQQIIHTFKECGVQKCGATHCTGDHQIELFRQAFGEDYIPIGTGRRITVSGSGLEITAMNPVNHPAEDR